MKQARGWGLFLLGTVLGVTIGLLARTPLGCTAPYPVEAHRRVDNARHLERLRDEVRARPSFDTAYRLAAALESERRNRILVETNYQRSAAPLGTRPEDAEIAEALALMEQHARGKDERRTCARVKNWLTE